MRSFPEEIPYKFTLHNSRVKWENNIVFGASQVISNENSFRCTHIINLFILLMNGRVVVHK